MINTVGNSYNHFQSNEVYNVGGKEYTSTEELTDKIFALLDKPKDNVEYISKEKANVTNKKPDITKAVNELGHNPSTMLDEGLPKTIDWMKKIYLEE